MMLEREVYIDCGNARRKASELRIQADEVRNLVGGYRGTVGNVDTAWKGVSARRFKEQLNTRVASLEKSAVRLDELAAAIEQTANAYEKRKISEIKAARAAKQSASGGKSSGGGGGGSAGGGGGGGR